MKQLAMGLVMAGLLAGCAPGVGDMLTPKYGATVYTDEAIFERARDLEAAHSTASTTSIDSYVAGKWRLVHHGVPLRVLAVIEGGFKVAVEGGEENELVGYVTAGDVVPLNGE